MNLKRWLSVILMTGLVLALNSLSAQADPDWPYHHPRGRAYGWDGPRHRAYGWDGPRHHDFDRHYEHFRRSCGGPHNRHYVERVYGGPPSVTYVTPVAPVMGIPYAPSQPYFNQQSAPPGLHGQIGYSF